MKKNTIFFIILLLIVLAVFFFSNASININFKEENNPGNLANPTQIKNSGLEAKISSEGPVAVSVTPLDLKNNSSSWNFEVNLDTHSGSLDADLVTVSELVDDQEKIYKPIAWEGDGPGGHHRKGILKFNPISPKPKFFELKIKNIGGVLERRLKWIF